MSKAIMEKVQPYLRQYDEELSLTDLAQRFPL